jgi:nitroreductase
MNQIQGKWKNVKELLLMDFEKVIKERMSVRKFKDEEISSDKMDKILEAGRIAPTAKNLQPQVIYVVKSEKGLGKIDEASPCRYNAPMVLLVCSDKSKAYRKDDWSSFEMDASIVATHMMLEATNVGVDSIWIEMFDKNKIKELFNLDDFIEPVCLLPLGYRSDDYTKSVNHTKRKPLSEMVKNE